MSTTNKTATGSDRIGQVINRYVHAGEIAGAATLVWRGGQVVHRAAAGRRDLATGLPVEPDTIFRIASMTKPITTIAALTMLEEGQFDLDTPVARVAPEFARMRVLRDPDGGLDDAVDAARPITFGDLLTHRSGLTYAEFHRGPIGAAYARALGGQIDNDLSPGAWIERLAAMPLIDQPGAGFHYGHSTDLLGFLIARIEGTTLGALLARRVFAPLGMRDTAFALTDAQRARAAGFCGFDDEGALLALTETPGAHARAVRPANMTFESGGQGLWSTLDDYLAFARLFVEAGVVDGRRLLRPETLALMTTNQLTETQRQSARILGRPAFAPGNGYGMGVAVVIDPATAEPLQCRGGLGTIGWPGAYGGWWQADPTDGSVAIFLAHNMVQLHQMAMGIGLGVWGAIGELSGVSATR